LGRDAEDRAGNDERATVATERDRRVVRELERRARGWRNGARLRSVARGVDDSTREHAARREDDGGARERFAAREGDRAAVLRGRHGGGAALERRDLCILQPSVARVL